MSFWNKVKTFGKVVATGLVGTASLIGAAIAGATFAGFLAVTLPIAGIVALGVLGMGCMLGSSSGGGTFVAAGLAIAAGIAFSPLIPSALCIGSGYAVINEIWDKPESNRFSFKKKYGELKMKLSSEQSDFAKEHPLEGKAREVRKAFWSLENRIMAIDKQRAQGVGKDAPRVQAAGGTLVNSKEYKVLRENYPTILNGKYANNNNLEMVDSCIKKLEKNIELYEQAMKDPGPSKKNTEEVKAVQKGVVQGHQRAESQQLPSTSRPVVRVPIIQPLPQPPSLQNSVAHGTQRSNRDPLLARREPVSKVQQAPVISVQEQIQKLAERYEALNKKAEIAWDPQKQAWDSKVENAYNHCCRSTAFQNVYAGKQDLKDIHSLTELLTQYEATINEFEKSQKMEQHPIAQQAPRALVLVSYIAHKAVATQLPLVSKAATAANEPIVDFMSQLIKQQQEMAQKRTATVAQGGVDQPVATTGSPPTGLPILKSTGQRQKLW